MRTFLYILLGIGLGIAEIALRFKVFDIPVTLSLVALIGVPLLLMGKERSGTVVLIAGALTLDLFSNFRPGIFLLSVLILLALQQVLLTRSFDTDNPIITWAILFISFALLHFIEFLYYPSLPILLINTLINSILGVVIVFLLRNTALAESGQIKVSDRVGI